MKRERFYKSHAGEIHQVETQSVSGYFLIYEEE